MGSEGVYEYPAEVVREMVAKRRALEAENGRLRNMVYRLARHVRNTDGLPVTRWAVHAGMLLDELRAADEAEYDRLVKCSEPTAGVAVEGGVGGGTDPR